MEELDLLKKYWKKSENTFEQVSEIEIYKMLHKKSSSIVKWILIISVLEVLLWTSISLCFNTDDYFKKIHGEDLIFYFEIFNYFNYAIILTFIYLFYKNYIKISTTVSIKQLMKDILTTRKTVNLYVWYNLSMITLSVFVGYAIAFFYNPQVLLLKEKMAHEKNNYTLVIIFLFLLVATIILVGLFWLFYKLLYGILLKKLHTNYKELKKIDL